MSEDLKQEIEREIEANTILVFPANGHNERYLATKARRAGHTLGDLLESPRRAEGGRGR